MSCRRTSTSTSTGAQDVTRATQNQDTDTDLERYTREISYTPNFQSIFSNPLPPQPGTSSFPQAKPTPSNSPGFHQTNHGDLLHQQQPIHLEQPSQNCQPAASQPARPPSQQPLQYSQPATSNGSTPSPHLLLPTSSPNLLNHQHLQPCHSPGCCIIPPHQAAPNNHQQHQPMNNHSDLYHQHPSIQQLNSYTTVAAAAAAAAAATTAARAMRNNLYHNIDFQQSQQQHILQSSQQTRPLNQQSHPPTTINHNYQPQMLNQNLNYTQDQTIQNRQINQIPNSVASESSNTMPRVAFFQSTQYQTMQQTAYSQSISLPPQTANQTPTETLAQTYHGYIRRPRARASNPNLARQPVTLVPIQQQLPNVDSQAPQAAPAGIRHHLANHLQNRAQPHNGSVSTMRPQMARRSGAPISVSAAMNPGRQLNQSITTNATHSTSNTQESEIVQQMPRLNNMLSNTRCSAPTTRLPPTLQRSAGANLNVNANRQVPSSVQRITEVNQPTQGVQTETRVGNETAVQQTDQETNPPAQTTTSCTSTTTNGALAETNRTEVSAFNGTPVSVSSTTRAINLTNRQHVSTQASHEVLNKACQFDGRNIMINKSLNAVPNVLDQVTQTEVEIKPTYVDRACSPIQIQHLQQLQQTKPLQPARMDVPVRRKMTAKRRKVDSAIAEKRKPEPVDSDTEIDILE